MLFPVLVVIRRPSCQIVASLQHCCRDTYNVALIQHTELWPKMLCLYPRHSAAGEPQAHAATGLLIVVTGILDPPQRTRWTWTVGDPERVVGYAAFAVHSPTESASG